MWVRARSLKKASTMLASTEDDRSIGLATRKTDSSRPITELADIDMHAAVRGCRDELGCVEV